MDEKEYINLFACFMDKYSLKNFKYGTEIYKKARTVHYALQDFIQEFELVDERYEYYDFFFEHSIKNDISIEKLLSKYTKGVLSNND